MPLFDPEKLKQHHQLTEKPKKYTILVVDDEKANLSSLSRVLDRKYNVVTAEDGMEALDIVRKSSKDNDIQLIISDQRMPNLTGVEFFKRVCSIAPNAVRILLTGFADIDAIIEAINDGKVYKYMTKPVENNELLVVVQRALENYELESKNLELIEELRALNANLEEKVEKRTEQLEKANQEMKDFMGMASHDLRSPISSIFGFSEIIANHFETLSPKEVVSFAGHIQDSSKQILGLVDNLLDVNRIDSEQGPPQMKEVDLRPIVEKVVSNFQHTAQSKGIELIPMIDKDSFSVRGNELYLRQVAENLLSNAIKYSLPNTKVQIGLFKMDSGVRLGIEDQGPGIDKEEQKRLFGRFARLSTKPTANEPSNGLGLYIVKSLSEKMQGKVWCESDPGKGSKFFVEFETPA